MMADPQIPPLSIDDRALFLLRRYIDYKEALTANCGRAASSEMLARFKSIANEAAFEDLQALLGRRGPGALRVEVVLRGLEVSSPADALPA